MSLSESTRFDFLDRWVGENADQRSPLHELPGFDHMLRMVDVEDLESGSDILGFNPEMTMLNMGPSHPSTHGVLRLILMLNGEEVVRSALDIGYLHTGIEKTAESLMYGQVGTAVTRMDYASPFFNELVFAMAVEGLLGVELPPRAVWIRMLLCELNRISSHLLYLATGGMEMGAVGMMLYGWQEREELLRFFQKVTGLRMNHNFVRPGGTAADLPAGWQEDLVHILASLTKSLDDYNTLLTNQPVFQGRLQGVARLSASEALNLSASGPVLRASGVAWDLRRDQPYLAYDQVDFDVLAGSFGDAYDRFAIRIGEIAESIKICYQVIDAMPTGDYRVGDPKVTPPPRVRIDESMEALIHHFKLFTEGMKVPEGEIYVAVESPRGELGCYLVSDGSPNPLRLHIKAPSFANLQSLPFMIHDGTVADIVAAISSIDPVMGDVDR